MTNSKKGGRPPKNNPALHKLALRLNDSEWAEFMTMYEKSGMKTHTQFIKSRIFNLPFRVITVDENTLKFYDSLKDLRAECRKIGVNYNQFITILRNHFTEQKAYTMSEKYAKLLTQVVELNEKAIHLTLQIIRQWLPK
ncbi:MAG: hypothetical protein R3Y50_10895 [Rikenellaceae bacterium]